MNAPTKAHEDVMTAAVVGMEALEKVLEFAEKLEVGALFLFS